MSRRRTSGYTLVEMAIVVAVLGVVLTAVYLFFFTQEDTARSLADVNRSALDGRMALDEVEGFLRNAGLVTADPGGEWHPVIEAGPSSVTFVSDVETPGMLGPEDTLTLTRDEEGMLEVTDASGDMVYDGSIPGSMTLSYYDGEGEELDGELLATTAGRDRIRRITVTFDTSGDRAPGSRTFSPPNLAYAGGRLQREGAGGAPLSPGRLGSRNEHFLDEDFETWPPVLAWEDSIESELGWVPIRTEDFETYSSWLNNWVFYSEDNGRIRRSSTISAHSGTYSMVMDAYPGGVNSLNAAIWSTDLSEYDEYSDQLRLSYWWKGYDEAHSQDGVFYPDYTTGSVVMIDSEDFTGFDLDRRGDWTYWNTTYGNIEVVDTWPHDGNYVNMDTRGNGRLSQNRLMWENDLSAWSASTDLELRYYFCSRDDETHSTTTGDFIGLADEEGISGPIALVQYLTPDVFPNGSWVSRTVDLDAAVPTGYDWSEFRIVFGQSDDEATVSQFGDAGISLDNVQIWENAEAETTFTDALLSGRPSGSVWEEETVDLDSEARIHGRPFSADYEIAFCQYDDYSYSSDGIVYDDIQVEEQKQTVIGWTHGAITGNDQWMPSDHDSYTGDDCWSVNGADNYDTGTHQAWLQTPDIDLTGYSGEDRISFSFHHQYDWAGDGDGCHVEIWDEDDSQWELLVPYWGYYTSSVPGLSGEPGWTGANSGWNYCVMDITEYAGQTTRVRFVYGLVGSSTDYGWDIDYTRVKIGIDWPQVVFYGWPAQPYADWFAYTSPSGYGDPSSAGQGSRCAGNDLAYGGIWDTYYEDNTHNALVSPPVPYDNSGGSYYYIQFQNCLRTEFGHDTGYLDIAAFGTTIHDTTWVNVASWSGYSNNWWETRIDVEPYLGLVGSDEVVFRFRMDADGTSSDFGGWNVDSIKCFSSTVPLPEQMTPLLSGGAGETGIVYISPEEGNASMPAGTDPSYAPAYMDDRRRPSAEVPRR